MKHLTEFMLHHWQLWLILTVILLLIFINEYIAQRNRAQALSTAMAIDMMNHHHAVVIDLRSAEAFRAGHILGAIRADEDDFAQKKLDKYKEQPIILVCPRGIQSVGLATKLIRQGFTKATVLDGGMQAWQNANLPIVKGKGK